MYTHTHTHTHTTDDPTGDNHLTIPDTTGTIITSGNFPSVIDTIRTVGTLVLNGSTHVNSASVRIGVPGGSSHVEFRGRIGGRFPLAFDGGLSASPEDMAGGCTASVFFCVCVLSLSVKRV